MRDSTAENKRRQVKNSVLDLVINQLKYSKFLENIIIATTSKTEDDVIEKFCLKNSF